MIMMCENFMLANEGLLSHDDLEYCYDWLNENSWIAGRIELIFAKFVT
jgi:hypothetical protein